MYHLKVKHLIRSDSENQAVRTGLGQFDNNRHSAVTSQIDRNDLEEVKKVLLFTLNSRAKLRKTAF